jgi:hypothetical protein
VQHSPDTSGDVENIPAVGDEFEYERFVHAFGLGRETQRKPSRIGLDFNSLHEATSLQNSTVGPASMRRSSRDPHEHSVAWMEEPSPDGFAKNQTDSPGLSIEEDGFQSLASPLPVQLRPECRGQS